MAAEKRRRETVMPTNILSRLKLADADGARHPGHGCDMQQMDNLGRRDSMDKARHPHVIRTWSLPRNRAFQHLPPPASPKGFRKPPDFPQRPKRQTAETPPKEQQS